MIINATLLISLRQSGAHLKSLSPRWAETIRSTLIVDCSLLHTRADRRPQTDSPVVNSNYRGAWKSLPPERPDGPREGSGLRWYKGACKRPQEITNLSIIVAYHSKHQCTVDDFLFPKMWFLGASRGLKEKRKIYRLAIASHILRPAHKLCYNSTTRYVRSPHTRSHQQLLASSSTRCAQWNRQLGFILNKPQIRFCSPHPSSQCAIRPAPNPPIDTTQGWKETHLTIHYLQE